jgi:hypothetical protein
MFISGILEEKKMSEFGEKKNCNNLILGPFCPFSGK